MCRTETGAPDLEDLIAQRFIEGHAAAILQAVWGGRGKPVKTGSIFDAMYADDPDGGPSASRTAYQQLNAGLAVLYERLAGSGVGVVADGIRRRGGFRLRLSDVDALAAAGMEKGDGRFDNGQQ